MRTVATTTSSGFANYLNPVARTQVDRRRPLIGIKQGARTTSNEV